MVACVPLLVRYPQVFCETALDAWRLLRAEEGTILIVNEQLGDRLNISNSQFQLTHECLSRPAS